MEQNHELTAEQQAYAREALKGHFADHCQDLTTLEVLDPDQCDLPTELALSASILWASPADYLRRAAVIRVDALLALEKDEKEREGKAAN